jgi:hypothetical protein
MQIDKLQIELRPRSHAQALDLGFALLRSHAGAAYMAFLALWLPLVALCIALTVAMPELAWLWGLVAWWLRPLLERAPLYVLSRQVFGTTVTWQEAVRAWPRQLGGGTFRLLVWGRILFASGRALMQPVWQLEMARGSVAAMRQRVISANGTGHAAFWFGAVCALLETVLQFGLVFFLAMFVGDGDALNPFRFMFEASSDSAPALLRQIMWMGAYAVGAAIIAPVYTACGFTLYLNRRASLEAWDLEIQLRQISRPAAVKSRPYVARTLALTACAVLLAFALGGAPDARAETDSAAVAEAAAALNTCNGPKLEQPKRAAPASPQQAQARKLVDQVYADKDLRGFECEQVWQFKPDKKKDKKKDKKNAPKMPQLNFLAAVFKIIFIALAIGAVGFLLYRYRDHFPVLRRRPGVLRATEVGGLDIRAESLPPDVTGQVRDLWARGERRLALALLYRATLSRLVSDDGLNLRQGDTEGDCLRAAGQAQQAQRLAQGRLDVARAATTLWLNGAYGDRWPDGAALFARCDDWDLHFGAAVEKRA